MNKISNGHSNQKTSTRGCKNKIKHNNASRLTYRDSNVVMDFNEEEINKLASLYKFECNLINDTTLQIKNNKAHTIWFCVNHGNFLELQHKNKGDKSIHSHFQSNHYQLDHVFQSVGSHDCYVSRFSDYRNTGIGKLFGLLESGNTKYIKLS